MTTAVLPIMGTHAWGRSDPTAEWWYAGSQMPPVVAPASPFCQFLRGEGCEILGADCPFVWDTDLDGIGWLKRRPHKKHINWESWGHALGFYLWPRLRGYYQTYVPVEERNIIAHSHAMQVVAYCCATAGVEVNRLLTIGSPVREDMYEVYARARPFIREWMHVHSDGSDRTQWFGTLFDGHLGVVRALPAQVTLTSGTVVDLNVRNVRIDAVGHSKLLNDPACFPLWHQHGLLDFLQRS